LTLKELINLYNDLSVSEKRKELGREIAELSLVVQKLLSDLDNRVLIDERILDKFDDLYDIKVSESQYLTSLYEQIINFKELLGIYFNNTIAKDYEDE